MSDFKCEVCEAPATVLAHRIWNDGAIDKDMCLCDKCAQSDMDGMFEIDIRGQLS